MSQVQTALTHPSTLAIAWMAGIIEGEGYMQYKNYTTRIEVGQKDDWIIWKLQELLGGTVGSYRNKKTQKDYWRWTASGSRARGIIMTLFIFFSPRRKLQALLALGRTSVTR